MVLLISGHLLVSESAASSRSFSSDSSWSCWALRCAFSLSSRSEFSFLLLCSSSFALRSFSSLASRCAFFRFAFGNHLSLKDRKRVKRHKRPTKTRETRKLGNDTDWVTSPTGDFRCSLAWNFASFVEARFVLASRQISPTRYWASTLQFADWFKHPLFYWAFRLHSVV